MTTTQLRREIKKRIDHFTEPQLRSAAEYLIYLDEYSDPIAIAMATRLRRAEKEISRGLVTPAHSLRRKY